MSVINFNLMKTRPNYTYGGKYISSLYNAWYGYKVNLPDTYVDYNINMPNDVTVPNYKVNMRQEDGRCPL